MKMSDELNKIRDILEEIRSNEHPGIPLQLIEAVLNAQIVNMDDSSKSQNTIRIVIDNAIKSKS